ncbi:hypothetical protein RJZ56_005991 [Blastomyces dermatitidis]|uniref:Protein trafficking Pga2 n=2 Tax=Ajellomyces dermatitidis TaxID=5039 RepID=F2TG07_AJEDA|nr:hypothetical protein, variant [Blastomyces dermatitidis ER-3]XP_045281530.1 uncharacterized protein BDCG_06073 [Blastomyces dermatitidis ER-3]EGE82170.1 hypothetical protein BDDG_05113 [Blastomyces dermatitidis ATCC 18188]EQL36025.1 hypothetical protein BDFG_02296 [Blastomyces dermatitidis ATCC 26199]EEQ90953.1 hypothetical protein, variant [Blastomyces dermatitidis ER-3]EQL36026.1 hypothetical protein, variant [Blastomyces dermatitidis ATCC 26199]OAT01803.1 hypothetical protein BDCG_06073
MATLDPTSLVATLQAWSTNLTTNVSSSVSSLTLRDYIRLVWIIGGYLFLRPYLDTGFRKLLNTNMDKSDAEERERERAEAEAANAGSAGATAKISANALRGALGVGSDSEDDEEGPEKTQAVPQWGKSARRRQKRVLRQLEEAGERLREDEDDKDIADLLED